MTAPRWDHHLLPGERLLWQGRPQRFAQGPVWRVILTLVGLVLLAFSGFVGWLTSVLSSDSGIAALAGTAAGGAMTLSAAGLGLWLIAAQWVTRLDRSSWTSKTELSSAMFEWIEGFYNPTRRHTALGNLSPVEFERLQITAATAA